MSVIRARDAGNVERGMQVLEAVLDRDARCDLALNAYALLLSEQLEGEHHRPQVPAHGQQRPRLDRREECGGRSGHHRCRHEAPSLRCTRGARPRQAALNGLLYEHQRRWPFRWLV